MDKRHLPRILRRAGVGIFLVSVGLLAGETARAQPSPPPTLNFAVRLPPDFEYSFGAFSVRPGVPAGQIELLVSGPTLAARRAEGETVGRVRLNLASRSISQLGPLFNPGGVIWNDRHLIWGLAHIGGRILQSRREYYNVSGENHPWLAHSGDLDGFTSPVGPFQELAFPNNYTAAHLIPIPASFGSAYLGGDNVGFGASGVSGATSTGGPALFSTVVPSADFAGHPILYYPHDRPETWIAGLPDRFTGEPSAWNNSSYVSGGTFTAGDDALFGGVQGYRPRPAPGSSNASMRVEARLVRYGAAALGQHAVAVRAGTANPWDLQPTQVIDLTPVHYYSDAHEEMIWHYTHVKVFPGSVPPRFYTEAEAEAVWISIANTVPYAYTDADGTTWRARDLGFLLPVWDRVNNLLLVMAQNGYLEADGWQNRPILYVLTYTTPSGRPVITRHPANQTVIVGQAATFSVQASGDAPLSYQWQRNGVNIAGAIASNYTTPATTLADNGAQFRSVVTNAAGSATSNAATLTVNPVGAPTITLHPQNRTVTAGQTATFQVSATGTAPLSYQWQRNGTNIPGATSSNYTTPPTTLADNGAQFRSVVTNAAGSATSNAATLTVTPPPPGLPTLSFRSPPSGHTVNRGITFPVQLTLQNVPGVTISCMRFLLNGTPLPFSQTSTPFRVSPGYPYSRCP